MNWRGPISVTFLICVIAFIVRVQLGPKAMAKEFEGPDGPKARATVELPVGGYSVAIRPYLAKPGKDVVLQTPTKTITRSLGTRGYDPHLINIEAVWISKFDILLLHDRVMDSVTLVDPKNGKIELVIEKSNGRAFASEINGKPGHEVTQLMNAPRELLGIFTTVNGPLRFMKNE